ncbi:MAG TPA: glycosyltransferase family 2 protein [Bacteroidota bacterium]|nr:glycosyltransferase family 2 protein [Bacteroidota bacterium]
MTSFLASTVILIPAFNASRSLPELIMRLRNVLPDVSILIVDDGSSDGTSAVAVQMHATVARHSVNQGKGAALQTGFNYILENLSSDSILTLDADLQHAPEDAPMFFETFRKTHADVIVGWRQRIGTIMPVHRRMSNAFTSFLVGTRTGAVIRDSQCGYRLIRRTVVEQVKLETTGFEAETEFLIKAAQKKFSIEFVPIQTIYGGEKSYMTHWNTTKHFAKILFRDWA